MVETAFKTIKSKLIWPQATNRTAMPKMPAPDMYLRGIAGFGHLKRNCIRHDRIV